MPSPSETVSYVAIGISALSLLVSVVNMVWNIYKERSLRARLKVRFGLSELHSATFDSPLSYVDVSATNLGPGSLTLDSVMWKSDPVFPIFKGSIESGSIIPDYNGLPLQDRLPKTLNTGDVINLGFRFPDFTLTPEITHVGFSDTFGRCHWSSACDVKRFRAKQQSSPQSKNGRNRS
jgi:hypothetical protein